MYNIENTYTNYDELIQIVGEEVVESRIEQIAFEMTNFLKNYELLDVVYVHENAFNSCCYGLFFRYSKVKGISAYRTYQ